VCAPDALTEADDHMVLNEDHVSCEEPPGVVAWAVFGRFL
jgi:hypothetical protein